MGEVVNFAAKSSAVAVNRHFAEHGSLPSDLLNSPDKASELLDDPDLSPEARRVLRHAIK